MENIVSEIEENEYDGELQLISYSYPTELWKYEIDYLQDLLRNMLKLQFNVVGLDITIGKMLERLESLWMIPEAGYAMQILRKIGKDKEEVNRKILRELKKYCGTYLRSNRFLTLLEFMKPFSRDLVKLNRRRSCVEKYVFPDGVDIKLLKGLEGNLIMMKNFIEARYRKPNDVDDILKITLLIWQRYCKSKKKRWRTLSKINEQLVEIGEDITNFLQDIIFRLRKRPRLLIRLHIFTCFLQYTPKDLLLTERVSHIMGRQLKGTEELLCQANDEENERTRMIMDEIILCCYSLISRVDYLMKIPVPDHQVLSRRRNIHIRGYHEEIDEVLKGVKKMKRLFSTCMYAVEFKTEDGDDMKKKIKGNSDIGTESKSKLKEEFDNDTDSLEQGSKEFEDNFNVKKRLIDQIVSDSTSDRGKQLKLVDDVVFQPILRYWNKDRGVQLREIRKKVGRKGSWKG